MKHVNAKEFLPPRLLRQLQDHSSGYIYVPRRDDFYERRLGEVLELHRLSCLR